jgi:hypothetical protein
MRKTCSFETIFLDTTMLYFNGILETIFSIHDGEQLSQYSSNSYKSSNSLNCTYSPISNVSFQDLIKKQIRFMLLRIVRVRMKSPYITFPMLQYVKSVVDQFL